jgi:large subunit ribosomal protein LP1
LLIYHATLCTLQGDKLAQVVKAADVDVPPFYVKLYARVLANRNLDDLLFQTVAVAPSAAPAAGAAAPAEAAAAGGDKPAGKPAKVEEEEEAEDMDAGGLFGGGDDDY